MHTSPQKIEAVTGRAVVLVGNDIDTDRIIPARFLRCVTFDNLGEEVFLDERYDRNGRPKPHPFNDSRYQGAALLVVNANFGCGSSREHAPQALKRFGIQAIIGESFAEIFAGNCLNLGMPVCTCSRDVIVELQRFIEKNPQTEFRLDVAQRKMISDTKRIDLEITPSMRSALLDGSWDSLEVLMKNEKLIDEIHHRRSSSFPPPGFSCPP